MSNLAENIVRKKVATAQIIVDESIQSRASLNLDTISQYKEDICGGLRFDPIIIYDDGSNYWLADGFHRTEASIQAGLKEIEAEIRPGSRRDAILHSVSANGKHGLPRNNSDKRKGVVLLLSDSEWSKWSNVQVANRCIVSESFVRKVRSELTSFRAKLEEEQYANIIGVSLTVLGRAITNSQAETGERIVLKGNTKYSLNIKNLTNKPKHRSPESSSAAVITLSQATAEEKSQVNQSNHHQRSSAPLTETSTPKVIPFTLKAPKLEPNQQHSDPPLDAATRSTLISSEQMHSGYNSPPVTEGQIWQMGESHLLFCGSPDAPTFRQQLPASIAISLLFPRQEMDLRLDLIPPGSRRQFLLFDPLQQEWDLQVFRDMIEHTLDNCTSPQEPVVILFLPDPELLLLMLEMDSPCYCAEPDPQRCAEAIQAWNRAAAQNFYSPAQLISP
jgi:hypothetical protein